MIKRIIVIVLSFLLLALCVGAIVFISNKQISGGQGSGVIVKFYDTDGNLYVRKNCKKGEMVSFPDYSAPEGYYFEGWKIDGSDEIVNSYEVKSSTKFVPVLSQIYIFDGTRNFNYLSDKGVSDYSSVSFDYKFVSGYKFAVALFGDRWHNDTYEYVVFDNTGYCGVYEGVSVTAISDGWLHVVLPYWVYETTCLSSYQHHDDYGSFNYFHVCKIASEYNVPFWGDVAEVFFKNITFNE